MRVLIAFDKFKGSLSAPQACDLAVRALRRRHREWKIDVCPICDGGEGFADILSGAARGRCPTVKVGGPRGGLVDASLALVPFDHIPPAARRQISPPGEGQATADDRAIVAVMEMATASGLGLLPPDQRDPWQTTTYGTGQLIRAAAELGAQAIVLGVGGSATNDLGLGALAALGLEFRGPDGGRIRPPVPAQWERINAIDGEVFPSIPPISIACDVTNPLLGPRGAAAVFGPQKGLQAGDRPRLESAMERMAGLLCTHCGRPSSLTETPGAGAAGGLPFGLLVAARARIIPGFDFVSAWLDLPARIARADIVITGEGRFDESSLSGKGPGAVARVAASLGKRVHVFAGQKDAELPCAGWQVHVITPDDWPLDRALREAPQRLVQVVEAAF